MPINFEKLNLLGLKRRGFTNESIEIITRAYQILYKSKMNVGQALLKIEEELGTKPEAQKIISFIKSSKRGIVGSRFYE